MDWLVGALHVRCGSGSGDPDRVLTSGKLFGVWTPDTRSSGIIPKSFQIHRSASKSDLKICFLIPE